MMGMFHMLMMYMHILSKRFSDTGVCDVLIQSSGVIAEGSVDKALCGKMYNRGVKMYKLMCEAIMRQLLSSVQFDSDEDNRFITHHIENLSFDQFWEEQGLEKHYNKFLDAKESMKTGHALQQFWTSFLEMTELLLNTMYSIRNGDWELLLICIRNKIPYTFAYDNINYARYLTVMLGDMLQLPYSFPGIYEEFMRGNFAAQLSDNTRFSRVETDKVIEMTLNKDTKGSSGCTGFSTNVNAVKRWKINATYRVSLRKCFHNRINYHPQKFKHPDLNP